MFMKSMVFALFLACAQALAQPAAGPHKALYLYQGADRDKRVLEGAKQEKQVVVYTSLNTKDSVPITQAFEKKYGVKVDESQKWEKLWSELFLRGQAIKKEVD